ncbi:alpha/beta hydrolase family protein [Actinoplanes palleronii]|uniref:Lipase n=1 Tax=Actinoplanes palleronii TaxID=113570 RepID=A0ABQ4BA86_9ACTN|nr:acetylhydrolase [Actinoplanes palleronii]GIE67553.1 lipase [Actinoplanes palleronii]
MTTALTRRHLLTTALAAGVALPLGAGRAAAAPARLTLPAPTGPHPVGTVSMHLGDRRRPGREMMASFWYPARDVRRHPVAPWLAAAPLRELLAANGLDPDVASPLTAGHEGAAVLPGGPRPVVVFSHGSNGHRSETTIVVQELASHGYVVVTVDHPDDSFSEFPDGRVTVPSEDDNGTPWDHAHDVRNLLDRIADLAGGRNPDLQRRPLPANLAGALDLHRIGMFGWSKGATATALVMNTDRRVRAGLSFDGPMLSQPRPAAIDRPFMLMTAEFTPCAEESGVAELWPLLHGWRRQVHAEGADHGSFCDSAWLLPQLAARADAPLDPAQAVRIQQAYPLAFFDRHLRGQRQGLLDGPHPDFPEMQFVSSVACP